MKKHISTIIVVVLILLGLIMLLYPTISNYTFAITEVNTGIPGISYSNKTITATVTIDGRGNITEGPLYTASDAPAAAPSQKPLTLVNREKPGVPFAFTKAGKDSEGKDKALEGAQFKLYALTCTTEGHDHANDLVTQEGIEAKSPV